MSKFSFPVALATFHILGHHIRLLATMLGSTDKEFSMIVEKFYWIALIKNLLMHGEINVYIDWNSDYLCPN